jgi:alpha,alpha-trehalase
MRASDPRFRRFAFTALVAALTLLWGNAPARETAPSSPAQLYGELFQRVQTERLFPDSKTFADATPRGVPEEILREYEEQKGAASFSLKDFVALHFDVPVAVTSNFHTTPREEVRAHIERLWPVLTRAPGRGDEAGSLLPMSTNYVVPGGRFREMYYWDSYFTMLGLQAGGHHDLVADMVDNFAMLIDRYGQIPNGARKYYLSRSQPPFFALMVELQAQHDGEEVLVQRLPQLEREYAFWMDGASTLSTGSAFRRVVKLGDGSVLNRYWDDLATPRDEAYLEDVETAKNSGRPVTDVYRDLRASAESGWDFSSRWLGDGKSLGTIRTTDIVPVDLNSLLYKLELTIARACKVAKRPDCQKDMTSRARARRDAIFRYLWEGTVDTFFDYDWRNKRAVDKVTAATVYPLFVGMVSHQQAQRVARTIRDELLGAHGVATTTEDTGQQWDAPNGWAPLQWIAIDGLRKNGENTLAEKIATAWIAENARVYCRTGKLVEKYNVRDAGEGAGGEYPVQDGFGWTNGVLVKLLALYPQAAARRYEFSGSTCATTPASQ